MFIYRYTSDIWGSESFSTTSLKDFQEEVEKLFEACCWGPAPSIEIRNDDELWAVWDEDELAEWDDEELARHGDHTPERIGEVIEEKRHCANCGSIIGLDCGEAEPDFDSLHCSVGCFYERNSDHLKIELIDNGEEWRPEVRFWDVFKQGWVQTWRVTDQQLSTLSDVERRLIAEHLEQ